MLRYQPPWAGALHMYHVRARADTGTGGNGSRRDAGVKGWGEAERIWYVALPRPCRSVISRSATLCIRYAASGCCVHSRCHYRALVRPAVVRR